MYIGKIRKGGMEKMTVNKAVALRISNLLKEKNMTRYRLEQNSGIQHGTMACIMAERNKTVTLSTIILISRGFNISLREFLNDPLFSDSNLDIE